MTPPLRTWPDPATAAQSVAKSSARLMPEVSLAQSVALCLPRTFDVAALCFAQLLASAPMRRWAMGLVDLSAARMLRSSAARSAALMRRPVLICRLSGIIVSTAAR